MSILPLAHEEDELSAIDVDGLGEVSERLTPFRRRVAAFRIALAPADRADFYVDLAVYVERDARLMAALGHMFAAETGDGRRNPTPLALFAADIVHQHGAAGEPFEDVVQRWLPRSEALALGATYSSGIQPEALRKLAHRTLAIDKVIGKIVGTLVPSSALIVGLLVLAWYGASQYLPPLLESYRMVDLKGQAQVLLVAGQALSILGPAIAAGAAAFLALVLWSLPNLAYGHTVRLFGRPILTISWRMARFRVWLDRYVFPYTLYREWTGLMWLLFIAAMLAADKRERAASEAYLSFASPYARERIEVVLDADDKNPVMALIDQDYGWPSPRLLQSMRAMFESPDPGKNLQSLADSASERLMTKLDRLAERVTRTMLLIMGAVTLWQVFLTQDFFTSFSHPMH